MGVYANEKEILCARGECVKQTLYRRAAEGVSPCGEYAGFLFVGDGAYPQGTKPDVPRGECAKSSQPSANSYNGVYLFAEGFLIF